MNSFKIKLIIITITFIMVFGDAYAGCQSNLHDAGYFSKHDGLPNFIDLFSNMIHKYANRINDYESIILKSFEGIYFEKSLVDNANLSQENDDKNNSDLDDYTEDQLYVHSIISIIKKTIIQNADKWCKSNAACVDELKKRGYIYNMGIFNYAFLMKEPSLISHYTIYLSKEGKKSNILNSDDWCDKHKDDIIEYYSTERKEKLKSNFKGRMNVLLNHVVAVCKEILKSDGFIHENGIDNYDFSIEQTYFINPYTTYLVNEAYKLANKIEGIFDWCNRRCLTNLKENGCFVENTGSQNLQILISQFKKNESDNEIVQAYYKKLLEEKKKNKLSTTTEFCKQY